MVGANNFASASAGLPATNAANIIATAQVFLNAGIPVLLCSTLYSTATLNSQKNVDACNEIVRQWVIANPKNVRYFDIQAISSDPASVTGAHLVDHVDSGLHPNMVASLAYGAELKNQFPELFKGSKRFLANSQGNAYDATYNTLGNRLGTKGLFRGTTGTMTAVGSTGTIGVGWTLTYIGAPTYTSLVATSPSDGSPVVRGDTVAGNWQRISGSTANAGSAVVRLQASLTTPLTVGKLYQINAEFRLSNTVDLNKLQIKFIKNTGDEQITLADFGGATPCNFTDTGTLMVSATCQCNKAMDSVDIQVGTAVGGSFTLDLMNIEWRQLD
jgi:hypothetical protein